MESRRTIWIHLQLFKEIEIKEKEAKKDGMEIKYKRGTFKNSEAASYYRWSNNCQKGFGKEKLLRYLL